MTTTYKTHLSSPITQGAGNVFCPVKDPNRSLKMFIFKDEDVVLGTKQAKRKKPP
jgi:hypothetical protein